MYPFSKPLFITVSTTQHPQTITRLKIVALALTLSAVIVLGAASSSAVVAWVL